MKKLGKIKKLYLKNKDSEIIEKDYLSIDKKGILKDKHYDKDINRSILITSIKTYEKIEQKNIEISLGELNENILVDFDIYLLPKETILKIGDVLLKITQNCTLCTHLSKIDSKLPKLIKNDRGLFFKVIYSGNIYIDDDIYII